MNNKKGEIYVTVCVFILAVVTVFSAILTYSSIVSTVRIQRTNTEVVFDGFVAENSIIIFNNIKQGSNAIKGVQTDKFINSLIEFCTFEEKNGMLYSINSKDGSEKFRISKPVVGFAETEKLELYTSYRMYIPVRFAGKTVVTAKIPILISSELVGKK